MTTKDAFFHQRLGLPPMTEDARVGQYLQTVADAVNRLPMQSVFSFPTPESNVTANVGMIGVNIASGASVLWLKQQGSGDTGWVAIG